MYGGRFTKLVFCQSEQQLFLNMEKRIDKASKIAIEARMHNIINRSALVVKSEEP
tara:strand:+ start:332 stop:496 length:165 start_codon:yes stop_codon:yes gene_type:complete